MKCYKTLFKNSLTIYDGKILYRLFNLLGVRTEKYFPEVSLLKPRESYFSVRTVVNGNFLFNI